MVELQSGKTMNNLIKLFVTGLLIVISLIFTNLAYASTTTLEARITDILEEDGNYQKLELMITKGEKRGEVIIIENGLYESSQNITYKVGDRIVVNDGFIVDYVRTPSLFWLFFIFVVVTIAVAGRWGALSLIGMAYTFFVIFSVILPMILKGQNAVFSAIFGSALIIPVTFSLSHGLNKKTLIAVFGTIITMVVVGILASLFSNFSKLSGFVAEEASFLQFQLGDMLNAKGVLLAGIIIASLGVLDDVTISQSSIVEEIRKANPKFSKAELFMRSMRVGRDHIASIVNTLILVYAGASLPLLLLFVNNPHPFVQVINYEIVAEEIVRTLTASIGLVLAVPITTYMAVASVKSHASAKFYSKVPSK